MKDSAKPYLDPNWIAEQMSVYGNATDIARATGIPARTLRRHVKRYKEQTAARRALEMEETCPISPLLNEVRIRGRGVVSSDWHLPLTSYENVARLIEGAIARGAIDWCAIVGDYFNLDAMSRFEEKQDDAGFELEIRQASKLLRILLDVFGFVIITKGNHDWRFLGRMGFKLKFERSIRMLLPDISDEEMERIKVTSLDYVIVESEDEDDWRCAHTNQYSKIPLSVPRELCDIHRCNVAAAHRHHHGITTSKGGFLAVELGGLFDASKTAYLRSYTNTFPHWTPGWMELHEGRPYLPLLAPSP
jgi:hypothetical protein